MAACIDQSARLLCAWAPQSMKTAGLGLSARPGVSQRQSATPSPLPEWLAGSPSSTVRQVLSNRTPFCAHFTRLPPGWGNWAGNGGVPRSRCSSLKILRKEGGNGYTGRHREGQAFGLATPVIRVLPQDNYAYIFRRRELQAPEAAAAWKHQRRPPPADATERPTSQCPGVRGKEIRLSDACQPGATGQAAALATCKWSDSAPS